MDCWMLQDQPHNSFWSEVLHPPHAGPAPHPHHCPGHPGESSTNQSRALLTTDQSQNSVTMNTLMGYQARVSMVRKQVRGAMEIALFIQNIQEERAEVALFIFTNQSTAATDTQREKNRLGIMERFKQTDQALEDVPTWPNVENILLFFRAF